MHKVRDYFQRAIATLRIEGLFAVTALVVGGFYVALVPPLQGWDESEHFFRAYQVSEINIHSDKVIAPNASTLPETTAEGYGGYLPREVIDTVRDLRFNEDAKGQYNFESLQSPANNSLDSGERLPVRFDNTTIYSPIAYMPQAAGILIGRVVSDSPVLMMYMARISSLIVWVVLIFVSLKLLRSVNAKRIFMVIALNPVSIFLAATISPDAFAAGLVSFSVSALVYLRSKQHRSRAGIVLTASLITAIAALALVKNVYIPLALVLIFVPSLYLNNYFKAGFIALIFGIGLWWNLGIADITSYIPSYFNVPYHVNSQEQLNYILENPIRYGIIMLWNIFGTNSLLVNLDYAGVFLANSLPDWVVVVWIIALIYTLTTRIKGTDDKKETPIFRYGVLLLFLGISALVITSLYLGWTEVASKTISGVQGRYFIPLTFLLIPVVLGLWKRRIVTYKNDVMVFGILFAALIATCLGVLVRYTVGV